MGSPAIVIVAIVAVGILFVLAPRALHIFARYRLAREVPCPETGRTAKVDIDASRAALTAAFGHPRLRVLWCTLWPGRWGCGQGCLTSSEVERPPEREAA